MKVSLLLVLVVLLSACASGHRKTSNHVRHLVMEKKYDEALIFLKKSPLAHDKKSRLLYSIELGLIEHYRGDYTASITALSEAREILDRLYTTKASGKIASALSNDNADYYYGERYEASMVHFYLGLNYYLLGQLEKARAEVMAWDTFITEMKNERLGSALFKDDLLAKTFGAFIHEAQGIGKDDQVALQLYKDAQEVFFKNYNLYPTFNSAYKSFRDNFKNLPSLSREDVEGKYVMATGHSSAFHEFLTLKILQLTKKVRPGDLKAQITRLKPTDEILKKLNIAEGNVTFLFQEGIIVEKEPKQYKLPMNWGPNAAAAFAMGMAGSIKFELPTVKSVPNLELAKLQALKADGSVADEAPLTVIAPLGELAEQAINEHANAIAAKTAARVSAKHIAAFVAAQAAMRGGSRGSDGAAAVGLLIGTIGHAAAIAAINESEKADVRFWSTLPSNIRMGQLSLPKGTYRFQAVFGDRVIDLGEQTVDKGAIKLVMNQNNFNSAPSIEPPPVRGQASAEAEKPRNKNCGQIGSWFGC